MDDEELEFNKKKLELKAKSAFSDLKFKGEWKYNRFDLYLDPVAYFTDNKEPKLILRIGFPFLNEMQDRTHIKSELLVKFLETLEINIDGIEFSYCELTIFDELLMGYEIVIFSDCWIIPRSTDTANPWKKQKKSKLKCLTFYINRLFGNLYDISSRDMSNLVDFKLHRHLVELTLMNLGLYSIPNSVSDLRNLKRLDITDNKITKLKGSLNGNQALEDLVLNDNPLVDLDSDLLELSKSLPNLTYISLNKIGLVNVPSAIRNFSDLGVLLLSSNYLTDIPKWIEDLPNLRRLDISYNKFEIFPKSVCEATSLTSISANNNYIREIPENINKMEFLVRFELQHNNLTEIPVNITKLQYLKSLWVFENNLSPDYKKYYGIKDDPSEGYGKLTELKEVIFKHASPYNLKETIDKRRCCKLNGRLGEQFCSICGRVIPEDMITRP